MNKKASFFFPVLAVIVIIMLLSLGAMISSNFVPGNRSGKVINVRPAGLSRANRRLAPAFATSSQQESTNSTGSTNKPAANGYPSTSSNQLNSGATTQAAEIEEADEEQDAAVEALESFFANLNQKKYTQAAGLLYLPETAVTPPKAAENPETSWEGLAYGGNTQTDATKAQILKEYCESVGTCLKSTTLNARKITEGQYELTVQFTEKSGDLFCFGPCDEAMNNDPTSVSAFNYVVKKMDGEYKVTRGPIYVP